EVVLEKVANEQISDGALEMRVPADEAAKAEAIVISQHELPHPLHAAGEIVFPLAKLGGRGVALGPAFANGVGRHLAAAEGQEHSGGIEGIEETVSVADQDPAVAGRLARTVGIFLGRPEGGAAPALRYPLLDAGTAGNFSEIDLLVIFFGTIHEQVIVRGHD